MTREPDVFELIARLAPCEYCGAPSGIPCATETGRRREAHACRWVDTGPVLRAVAELVNGQVQGALNRVAAPIQ